MMRVLSVRQPWAHAIFHGKDVENRSRSLGPYRGPVAIHASLTKADTTGSLQWPELLRIWREHVQPGVTAYHLGAIIGVVDLVDEHDGRSCDSDDYPLCSVWADFDSVHLELRDARPLAEPIPFKGGLGLRVLPDAVEAAVLRGLA